MNFNKVLFCLLAALSIGGEINLLAQNRDTLKTLPDSSAFILSDTSKKINPTDTIKIAKETGPRTSGGYVLKGKIIDQNTSEGIPFATVFFARSSIGAPADLDGNFEIRTTYLPGDTLRSSAMGYNGGYYKLNRKKRDQEIVMELDRSSNSLKEVVVHAGEDPALILLRKIIARKPYNNPDKLDNYRCESYNKLEVDIERMTRQQFEKIPGFRNYSFIFDNIDSTTDAKPFLPLYMTETMSDYYFQKDPKKQREYIKASFVKGFKNESVTEFMGISYQNVNPYNNLIPVLDKQFISPISALGSFYYKYAIRDTQQAYGHNIILVQFSPRRKGEYCFTGDFWVVDSIYALQRINMVVPDATNINWVSRVNLFQEFAPLTDSLWFCVKDKFVVAFNLPYDIKIPGFIGRKTTVYHKIAVNDDSVIIMLNNPEWHTDVTVADTARKTSEQWWAANRLDTLNKNEKAIYKMIDTIENMPITRHYINTIKFLINGTKDIGYLQLGPYYYLYSYNQIEGHRFRLSLGTSEKIKDIHFTGYLAYGTRDEAFKYGFTGLWILNHKPRTTLYAEYTYDVDHSTNYYDKTGSDNIFNLSFRKHGIPWKLAFTNETLLEFFKEYQRGGFNGFSHTITLHHNEFTPYEPGLPANGIFVDKSGLPTHTVTISDVELNLRYAFKEKTVEGPYKRLSLGSKYPIVNLKLGMGFKDVWNSGYDYQKVRFTISDKVKIAPFGMFYYTIFAGKYFGKLPYPLLEIIPGNEYYYYNAHAFEMMNKYEFISDEYAGFMFEHTIGGGVFNYIPFLKKAHLRQFWTAKGVIGSLSAENTALNMSGPMQYFRTLEGNPYIELGTGVSNILEIFRIDFVWRVTPKLLPWEGKERYFGIFASMRFVF